MSSTANAARSRRAMLPSDAPPMGTDSQPAIDFLVRPGRPLQGSLRVPGDKSISHRALMLGAIAEGDTPISGFLASDDTQATLAAFVQMGVSIERLDSGKVMVHGVGLDGLRQPPGPLNLGNSGTSARLLAGVLAGQPFDSELAGDASLSRRPMRRIVEPLARMGARISCSAAGTLPLAIHGGARLAGIDYEMPVASAQLKSALLLAGLYATGTTCVREPQVTRDHTERMLHYFGCPVVREGSRVCVRRQVLRGKQVQVPGDISSAAFFLAAACIVPGSDILLRGVGVNPTRSAVIDILRSMGADIAVNSVRELCGEPVADIRVRSRPLRGVRIPDHLVSIAIDEFPAILVAAAFAEGATVLSGAAELRVKESDRIAALAAGLQAIGIRSVPSVDGIVVHGGKPAAGVVDSHGDHRIAMAFAVAGLGASGAIKAVNCHNVNTSFPDFAAVLRGLGGAIDVQELKRD